MKVSALINKLKEFRKEEGDLELSLQYWCYDCKDTHESKSYSFEIIDGKLKLSVTQLWES